MIDLLSNIHILGIISNDCNLLGKELPEVFKDIYGAVKIGVPFLLVLLCSTDILRAIIAQDEKEMKQAQSRSIKRVIIGMAIFLVPLILDVLLDLIGLASGTCGIGG